MQGSLHDDDDMMTRVGGLFKGLERVSSEWGVSTYRVRWCNWRSQ